MEPKAEKAFPLRKAYPFAEQHGLTDEAHRVRDMDITWDRPYTTSLRRGFMIELFQRHGLLPSFKEAHWRYGLTRGGEEAEVPTSDEFALEAHLRDFLAKCPERFEPGLQLHSTPDNEGVEYPVDDGRIDILAFDQQGKFVVVELKLSRGRNRALGQLLYYMGWVDKNLGKAPCRGIIVANEITENLITAVSRAPGVTLYRYRMNFTVEKVPSVGAA